MNRFLAWNNHPMFIIKTVKTTNCFIALSGVRNRYSEIFLCAVLGVRDLIRKAIFKLLLSF